jgi:hypothetical protein
VKPLIHMWRKSSWAVLLSLGLGALLLAQPDTGTRSVEGRVLDSFGHIVVGAVVQIKDMKSLQVRSFITQDAGAYHFVGLSPNADYELTASKEGITSRVKDLRSSSSRKKTVIDLTLK